MEKKLSGYLLHPLLLSLVLAMVLILFDPFSWSLYRIQLVNEGPVDRLANESIFHYDLNNDGITEWIRLKDNILGNTSVKVSKTYQGIHGQWNLYGKYPGTKQCNVNDWNRDGIAEIFIVTQKDDSAFLNYFTPYGSGSERTHKVFLTTIGRHPDTLDFYAGKAAFFDLNRDSKNEVILSINAGFARKPRRVFAIDLENDSVWSSAELGVKTDDIRITEGAGGSPYISVGTNASGNIAVSGNRPMHDWSSWFMLFDARLNFRFQPLEFRGWPGRLFVHPEKMDSLLYFIVLKVCWNDSTDDLEMFSFDAKRNLVAGKKWEGKRRGVKYSVSSLKGNPEFRLLCINERKTEEYDPELNLLRTCKHGLNIFRYHEFDLTGDTLDECIIFDQNRSSIFVTDRDYEKRAEYGLPGNKSFMGNMQPMCLEADKPLLFLQQGNTWSVLKYERNPRYYLRYLFYLGILLFSLSLVYVIRYSQRAILEAGYRTRREIAELQIKTISSQMDPHFTFNVMNTIGALIYKDEKDKAQKYFMTFSKMVRETLQASDRISRSLKQELEFTETYLELERIRSKDKFDYEVSVDEGLDLSLQVPKMIIQIYAENAVKHGLRPSEKRGKLDIIVRKEPEHIRIIIRDNGVGRKRASELGTAGTGKGMDIAEKIMELYAELKNITIGSEVKDLKDVSGQSPGTEITLIIPQKVNGK